MRSFTLFLYENFDAEAEAQHPCNPRRLPEMLLSRALSALAHDSRPQLTQEEEAALIGCGILKREDGALRLDTPVFFCEDAQVLLRSGAGHAMRIADAVEKMNFPEGLYPQDLYHLLCGGVFDGSFFDYLASRGAVAVSRMHESGLDYLAILYENCKELNSISDKLLCSYNRCTDGALSLQTFGDADGVRCDFYRAFRLRESGTLNPHEAKVLKDLNRDEILAGTKALLEGKECPANVLHALEHFGYAKDGRICVPVYGSTHKAAMEALEAAAERELGDIFLHALQEMSKEALLCAQHGVRPQEIANELYHILFGMVNEELVRRGIVEEPPYFAGQGRYLRCIWVQ